jgi:hypothetical protein
MSIYSELSIVAVAAVLTVMASGEEKQMRTVETFGRVAWTDGGFLVQDVEVTTYDGGGEVVKQEKFWEVCRRLSDAESIRLKNSEMTNGYLVKDLSVPGARLRKE